MTLLTSLTDEELIQDMRSGNMTAVEIELVNRLERALEVTARSQGAAPPVFTLNIPEVLDADGNACEPSITLTEPAEFPATALVEVFRTLLELDPPEYHAEGLGCGLEDRGITNRYEAMAYGFDRGVEAAMENVHGAIADVLNVATADNEV